MIVAGNGNRWDAAERVPTFVADEATRRVLACASKSATSRQRLQFTDAVKRVPPSGARVCNAQKVASIELEDPGQIARTVEHAGRFNAVVRWKVKDEAVADPIAAEVHGELRSGTALLWNGGQGLALEAELVDELTATSWLSRAM